MNPESQTIIEAALALFNGGGSYGAHNFSLSLQRAKINMPGRDSVYAG